MNQNALRVLIVEDMEEDALRLVNELYRGGYDPTDKRVETADAMKEALEQEKWDIILSDYDMPDFSGLAALELLKKTKLDLPFIIVSGAIGEEKAVTALRAGAHDFIGKSNLTRLLPAINRELKDAETRRKRAIAEKALRETEDRYKAIFEGTSEGILLVDIETKSFIYANPALCNMLGYSEEELQQLHEIDIHPKEALEYVISEFEAQSRGEKSLALDIPCLRKNGTIVYADINTTKIRVDGRDCNVGFFTDITPRRRAEQTLHESVERFSAIANTVDNAIIMIDADFNINYWNPGAELIFGYTCEETMGGKIYELIVPQGETDEYQMKIMKMIKSVITHGERRTAGRTYERTGIKKDGTAFPIELTNSAVELNGLWHSVEIIRDISEKKQFEAQLRQSQKMEAVGTLASGIAHEINTPIQFVGNNIRFLEDSFSDICNIIAVCRDLLNGDSTKDLNDDRLNAVSKAMIDSDIDFLIEEIPKAIEQSQRGILNVTRIVSAMRLFAHPGTEKKESTDIHKAIESTIAISRNEWKYVADLETDFDPALPPVPCYVGEFNQVILNLIVNAAHAIEQALNNGKEKMKVIDDSEESKDVAHLGKIRITTRKKKDNVEIAISDTGIGIDDSVRNRVFDPFFTTKKIGKGTGQGLTLAHNVIAGKHGGEITFESEVGVGTTFIVRLPLISNNKGLK